MDKNVIKKIKDCRNAIEDHRKRMGARVAPDEEHAASVTAMMDVIRENGFDNLQAYAMWDEAMCFQMRKEARPILGTCDGCPHVSTPPCVEKYGPAKACVSDKLGEPASDGVYRIAWAGAKKGEEIKKSGFVRLVCPEGHGYYLDETAVKTPDFDYNWSFYV